MALQVRLRIDAFVIEHDDVGSIVLFFQIRSVGLYVYVDSFMVAFPADIFGCNSQITYSMNYISYGPFLLFPIFGFAFRIHFGYHRT